MSAAALILALGGEAVSNGETGLDVIFIVSIVGGYVVLACLWYFVFRERSPRNTKRKRDSSD